jgi:hypothetical protein
MAQPIAGSVSAFGSRRDHSQQPDHGQRRCDRGLPHGRAEVPHWPGEAALHHRRLASLTK